jgi:alpha-glucosidase (family GH31 glycosyl hydrolase)
LLLLFVGSDILVKAVGESGVESVQVYFPGGGHLLWFSAQLDGTFYPGTGLTDVPVTIDRVINCIVIAKRQHFLF